MPTWSVQESDGRDEMIEAGLVATEGGALVALTDDGLLSRAWAPGHWRSVRRLCDAGRTEAADEDAGMPAEGILLGLPRR